MSDEVKTLIEIALPVYLATSVCAILVAVTIAQGTSYYRNYDGDSKIIKYFVLSIVILSIVQVGDLFYNTYFELITCRLPHNYKKSNAGILIRIIPPSIIHYGLTFLTQCFYTLRVWFVSGHKTWLTGIIIVLSILQLGTGIAATAYVGTLITQGINSTSTILCDALISGSLVYFLREKPLNRSMRIGIGKITIYSINIGLITVAVSTITLITWLAAPHPQLTWEIFYYPAAQVYVNSVLVSLNARKEIRAQMIKNYSRPQSSMFMSFNVDSKSYTLRFSKNVMPLFNPIYEN
ncbi:hypothetical protein M422DRAFT_258090 [Sphaerobolus stellatus SS14]|uniref:DUF6534 domain-containing protein n=1 Tax=Sphaerobolus stellatus (strain SS14) TaxID=990650 RepID=A0A0C9VML9_SPHS4|nr:hypothetical protein M422DRAFT_258090 [Sphaerobolus stellatus SS14]